MKTIKVIICILFMLIVVVIQAKMLDRIWDSISLDLKILISADIVVVYSVAINCANEFGKWFDSKLKENEEY